MKRIPKELLNKFEDWYNKSEHTKNKDLYKNEITEAHLKSLNDNELIKFFIDFYKNGGGIQGGGARNASRFGKEITKHIEHFRKYILQPFQQEFDVSEWLSQSSELSWFGAGIATIYLHRVNSAKYSIYNQKVRTGLSLLGTTLPNENDRSKLYSTLSNIHQNMLDEYSEFDSYFTIDSFYQFIVGEPEGTKLATALLTQTNNDINYWLVGSVWDRKDQLDRFIKDGIWENGHDNRYLDLVNSIKPGDKIAIKSAHTQKNNLPFDNHGRSVSVMTIKAAGTVQENMNNGQALKVNWEEDYKLGKWYFYTGRSTVWQLKKDQWYGKNLIDFVFYNGTQDINRFRNDSYWRDRFGDDLLPIDSENVSITEPLNIILYGPPGTGKTYELQQEWFKKYTSEHATQTKEEFNIELVSNLAWWEVITAVMLDLKEAKVPNVFEHPLLQAKISISHNQSPKNTIWSWLQRHTKLDCENVNFTKRDEPLLFTKDSKGIWSIDTELASNEVPELVKLLESYKHYKPEVKKEKRYTFVTFHQAFGYEEFVEGIRPVVDEENEAGEISYRVEPGIFRQICKRAQDDQNNKYAIFIDEINRGNIAKILGELITLIEPDKRLGQDNELTVKLPYSKDIFGVPANLDIIGTMNTADRSIAQIDTALRRRFEFKELMPKPEVILGSDGNGNINEGINIREFLKAINERIEFLLNRDHMIGHSYFISVKSFEQLVAVLRNRVIPLLQEYFYEDWHRIQLVFKDVIDPDGNAHKPQIICHESFNEIDILGFDHDDYEDDKRYCVNETITPEAIRKVYQK